VLRYNADYQIVRTRNHIVEPKGKWPCVKD
jgi:hypothetical protein